MKKKIKKPSKEKSISSKKEKKTRPQEKNFNKKHYKKSANKKINHKKHKLAKSGSVSDASSDEEGEEEVIDNKIEESESEAETETETEEMTDDDEDSSSTSTTDNEVDSDDDFAETQPLLKKKSRKRKKPVSDKQNANKAKKSKKQVFIPGFEGWDISNQVATKDIDFSQWQTSHPSRETFFIGPDHYIYHNSSAMKKFVEAIKKKQVEEKAVSIPIAPMSKVVATNPRITIGVTGARYISQNGEGYRVAPIFYIAKEYVSCIYFITFIFFSNMLYFFCR